MLMLGSRGCLYRGVGGVIKSGFTEFRWIPRLSVFHLLLGRVTSRRCKHLPEVLLFSMQVLFLERLMDTFHTSFASSRQACIAQSTFSMSQEGFVRFVIQLNKQV